MGCPHGEWDGPCGQCDFEAGKVGDPRDAEIARLKADVTNQRHEIGMMLGEIGMMLDEIARLRLALAAGPAALRAMKPPTHYAAARVVEAAQAAAMKEGT